MGKFLGLRGSFGRPLAVFTSVLVLLTILAVTPGSVDASEVPLERFEAPNVEDSFEMGFDMDASGTSMAVGAPSRGTPAGEVYVYESNGEPGGYSRVQILTGATETVAFGRAIAMQDDLLVVGGNRSLSFYGKTGPVSAPWVLINEITGTGEISAVDIRDGVAIIASRTADTVEIRSSADGFASVIATLTTPTSVGLGVSVGMSPISGGNGYAAVGLPRDNTGGTETGIVYTYKLSGGTWNTAPDETLSNPDTDTAGDSFFGNAVEISQSTLFVGHQLENESGADSGAVWVIEGAPGAFNVVQKIKASSPGVSDAFGGSLGYDHRSNLLIVGTPADVNPNLGQRAGSATVLQEVGATWTERELLFANDPSLFDNFGHTVALASETFGTVEEGVYAFAAANGVDTVDGSLSQDGAGAVYPFYVNQPDTPANKILNPDGPLQNNFGDSVANIGDTLLIGSPGLAGADGEVEVWRLNGAGTAYTREQTLGPSVMSSGFGAHVAANETQVVIAYRDTNQFDVFERPDDVSPYAFDATEATAHPISAIDVDDATLIIGSTTNSEFSMYSLTPTISSTGLFAHPNGGQASDVAVSGNTAAVSMIDFAGSGGSELGVVSVGTFSGGAWTFPTNLTNPDTNTTQDVFFGHSVDLDGSTLVVGHNDSDTAPFSGAVWIYEETSPGTFGTPVKIKSGVVVSSNGFGSSVHLDTDILVVGERGAGNGPGLNGRTGSAWLVKRNPDTGVWSRDSQLNYSDRNLFDRLYGDSVTVSGGEIAVGAPGDDNQNGEGAGAVYFFDTTIPTVTPPPVDDPTLTITVAPGSATAPAGATGISVVDLPPTAIEGYGGENSGNVVGTSLESVDGAATPTDPSELLDETTIGDLGLEGSILDSILLSDIIIEGGWDAILLGTAFEGLPLQNVTLAEALSTGNLDGASLTTLDLNATPVGAIPVGAIALASTPVGAIPLEGGQSWCDLLGSISPAYNCSTNPTADPNTDSLVDLAIQGTPVGAIPVGAIPVGAIPIESLPVGAIPVGAIDIQGSPVGAIPVGAIPVGAIPVGAIPVGAIPVGAIPVGAIDIGTTPVGAIPVGAITIGAIQLGDLTANGGVAASPVGAIPVGAIDLNASPVGAIPVGAIPVGAIPVGAIPVGAIEIDVIDIGTTPVGAIPVGAIDITGTPVGAIPVGAIPVGAIPVGAIPVGAIPIRSIPVGAIPVGAIPVGAIPVGAIDLQVSPVGAIPVGAIPVGAIGDFVDCNLIDCDGPFTLADAQDAGALRSTATLALFEGLNTGVTLGDLIGVEGLDDAAIRAQLETLAGLNTLADFLTFDDMTLADLPPGSQLDNTTLEDLGQAALALITLGDLLDATFADEADLRAELVTEGINLLRDFGDLTGMTLADLPETDSNFASQTIDGLLQAFENIRLGDILDFHPNLDGSDVDWGSADVADVSDWQDVTLGELTAYGATTLAELVTALPPEIADELTFGDLLLAIVGTQAHDWGDIELGALELDATSSPVTFATDFEITGGEGLDRTLTLRTTIPIDGVYVPGSTVFEITGFTTSSINNVGGVGEPTVDGNQLTWNLNGVEQFVKYRVSVDIAPSLSLGTSTVSTEGTIAGVGVQSTALASIGISQAFEPNDAVGDAGILTAVTDTIYASHIATADDVDLYRIDLQAGSRLAVSLSDLPADYDLVLYGPPSVPVSDQPALRQLNPTDTPEVTLEAASNDSGGAVLQDVPLQDLPVIDVANNRDLENEAIDIASVRSTGTYYIQVSGYSGATSTSPYALFVKAVDPPAPLVCVAQDYQNSANAGTLPSTGDLAGVNSLILVNEERMIEKFGATDAAVALDAIDDLVEYTNVTNTGLGITSVVVPVDGDGNVRAAYNDLDAAACEPDRANAVVREINRVIDDMRNADSSTEITHVTIVGDDDIIPMARLADDTTIANESSYAQTFLDTNANSYFGALINSNFLSDEPYGDLDPIQSGDRILYVTDMALGRLVERPAEIAGQVLAFIGFNGQLDASTAAVTGYDFLDDGAQAVADALAALPDTTSVDSSLINEVWTDDDVDGLLFPEAGPSPQVASINAHYDHYRALPADQNAAGVEEDLFTTADVDLPARVGLLSGRSLHSMGCHSGLHVPDELFPGGSDPRALDWAQVYARQGATWVGNTGYGYGETEGVELSERLMTLYAERLDGSVSAGEALFYAKQTYLGTQQAEYGAFDEKVLQQATFYGIPFYELDVAVVPEPAPLPPQPTVVPVPGSDLQLANIAADPSFIATSAGGDGLSYDATLAPTDDGVTDNQATPFSPIQPTASFDVSFVGEDGEPVQVAQGALITSLTTRDVGNVDPDLALPIVDDSNVEVEPQVGDINTDPALYVSTYETPEGSRQSLTTLLGTFSSDQEDGSGTQRLYEEIGLDVYYRSPASDGDQIRPTFTSVESTISGGVLLIDATVEDNIPDNIVRVLALVVQDAALGTPWTPVELVDTGNGTWSGSLLVTGTEIEYMVQAIDGSGNSALTTNKARLFAEDPTPPPPPADPLITVSLSSEPDNPPFYDNTTVTITGSTDGEPIDYQLDGGEIVVTGASSASVPLDPEDVGDGQHTVRFISGDVERSVTILFDTTDPVVSIASPVDGETYDVGSPILAQFSCADAASGIASCEGLLDGNPIEPGDIMPGIGEHTLVLTGTDGVGNDDTTSVTFTVADTGAEALTIERFNVDGIAAADEPVNVLIQYAGAGTHGVNIDWGDGNTCTEADADCSLLEPTVDDLGEILGTHVYSGTGVFTVAVTITSSQAESVTLSEDLLECTITGTSRNDRLNGTNGPDVICGLGGRDTIRGLGGDDVLIGGTGRDLLLGGNDDDLLIGLDDIDRLIGNNGDDELRGGAANDLLSGSGGNDVVIGGPGNDRTWGDGGDDILIGNGGRDRLTAGTGDDMLFGGRGNDWLLGLNGIDILDGGSGADGLNGGRDNDDLRGRGGNDFLRGGPGNDAMDGGADNDRCVAGGGTDTFVDCER